MFFFFFNDKEPQVVDVTNIEQYVAAQENIKKTEDKITQIEESSSEYVEDAEPWAAALEEQKQKVRDFIENYPAYNAKIFGDNMAYLVEQHRMKISDLETVLGLSAGYISRTLGADAKRRMSIDSVWKISELFQVNMDDLLTRDLSKPTEAINPLIDFIHKLKEETDAGVIHWKTLGQLGGKGTELLYNETTDSSGKKVYTYAPENVEGECGFFYEDGDIYKVELSIGEVYLVPVSDFGPMGYDLLLFEDGESYGPSGFTVICSTSNEFTGTLTAEATKLVKSINEHKNDYFVTARAKQIISSYLNPGTFDTDDEMPFN